MQSRPFPLFLLGLIVAIAVVNGFAESYYWYWRMRWFDMPMHFAGGVWLAGMALWWKYRTIEIDRVNFRKIFLYCVGVALGIGLGWEIFEAVVGLATVGHINEMSDTLGDLFFDALGGTVVSLWFWWYGKGNLIK